MEDKPFIEFKADRVKEAEKSYEVVSYRNTDDKIYKSIFHKFVYTIIKKILRRRTTMNNKMFVFSDYACPFCYIGKGIVDELNSIIKIVDTR